MEKNYTSKNYFDNYHEVRATRKKLKKSQKQKNVTVFSECLFAAEQHVISSSQLNVLIGHLVDTARLLLIIIQNQPARTVKLF